MQFSIKGLHATQSDIDACGSVQQWALFHPCCIRDRQFNIPNCDAAINSLQRRLTQRSARCQFAQAWLTAIGRVEMCRGDGRLPNEKLTSSYQNCVVNTLNSYRQEASTTRSGVCQ
jgi:hypothetical protein